MMSKVFRCVECGKGMVRRLAKAGRTDVHKTMKLKIPARIKIPTCDACGAEFVDDQAARDIDAALEVSYRKRLHVLARRAIDVLSEHTQPTELERKLGLSQGYLSRLKNGSRDPSPDLVVVLSFLARAPKTRLRELEDIWKLDPAELHR